MIQTLEARYDELCARLMARETAQGMRRISCRCSAFRGYGVPEGLPAVGSQYSLVDAHGLRYEGTVVNHGAYWSDATIGHHGRWITVEVPAIYWAPDDVAVEQEAIQLYYEIADAAASS